MTDEEIRASILRILGEIAPEADLAAIDPHESVLDQLDIDSMDFLNFLVAIDTELHVDVPERDTAEVMSLDGCVTYLSKHLQSAVQS